MMPVLKKLFGYILPLLVIIALLTVAGSICRSLFSLHFLLREIASLSIIFSVISAVTLFIFLRGQTREPDSQTLHTLVAVTLKFLLDMTIGLIWLIILKKNSPASVIIFFVIYLTLTLFTILAILKILRNRSL
jgi:hypothetical protein